MVENEHFQSSIDWDNFQPGQTLSLKRQEMLQDSLENLSGVEHELGEFLKALAKDPNIGAIALSNIKGLGGVYIPMFSV